MRVLKKLKNRKIRKNKHRQILPILSPKKLSSPEEASLSFRRKSPSQSLKLNNQFNSKRRWWRSSNRKNNRINRKTSLRRKYSRSQLLNKKLKSQDLWNSLLKSQHNCRKYLKQCQNRLFLLLKKNLRLRLCPLLLQSKKLFKLMLPKHSPKRSLLSLSQMKLKQKPNKINLKHNRYLSLKIQATKMCNLKSQLNKSNSNQYLYLRLPRLLRSLTRQKQKRNLQATL